MSHFFATPPPVFWGIGFWRVRRFLEETPFLSGTQDPGTGPDRVVEVTTGLGRRPSVLTTIEAGAE